MYIMPDEQTLGEVFTEMYSVSIEIPHLPIIY